MLDMRRLEVLTAVLRHGSFSAAAAELHVSQPAVSHSLATLERQLGQTLVLRGRGGVTATAAGDLLAEHAQAVLDRLAVASDQLRHLHDDAENVVRVGAFSSALATVVPDALRALRGERPHLVVEATEGPTERLVELVRTGQVDIAVGYDDAQQPANCAELIRTDLFTEALRLALPPGHAAAEPGPVALAQVSSERWLTPAPDHLLVRACRTAGFEPTVVAHVRDALAIRAMVLSAHVVTLTPEILDTMLPPVVTVELAQPVRRTVFAVSADPPSRRAEEILDALFSAVPDRVEAARARS